MLRFGSELVKRAVFERFSCRRRRRRNLSPPFTTRPERTTRCHAHTTTRDKTAALRANLADNGRERTRAIIIHF